MSDYVPDGIAICRHCGAPAPYLVGPDGEHYFEGQQHNADCPDSWPEECPF